MALTTPKMALKVWNLLTDPYDHDQLADNWAKVDQHDHTSSRGVQIPTEGIFDGAITSAKLATGLDPAPLFTAYKALRTHAATFPSGAVATTYLIPSAGSVFSVGSGASAPCVFYLDPTDFAVSSRTTYFRIRNLMITNAIAPAVTFTFGLQPVATWNGASGTLPGVATVGSVVAGSVATITTPAASGPTSPAVSADFVVPSAGWYCLTVVTSGTAALNSVEHIISEVEYRTT